MKNKTILVLLLIVIVISGSLFFLNSFIRTSTGNNPIGLGIHSYSGDENYKWFNIVPVGISLSGLFLTLIMVPLLFRNSLIDWKNNGFSWKWQLPLVLIILFVGTIMTFAIPYLFFITIPFNLFVFSISIFITLIMVAKVNPRSSFFYILLIFAIPIIGASLWYLFELIKGFFI